MMKSNAKFLLLTFCLILTVAVSFAQDVDDPFTIDYDTPLTIDLEAEDEEAVLFQPKKKKVKKSVFYGLKTKRGHTRRSSGRGILTEEFRYLKNPIPVDPYVRDIFWYNFKKRTLMNSRKFDKKNGVILHGPYTKKLGDQIIEQGIYYKGTKHGRWIRLDKNDILRDKEKYYKGWPKLSKVIYYDKERKKLREIIPVQLGEREGNYFAFHESGRVAAKGEYQFDHKVGVWTEYYDDGRRKKREIQYPEDPFNEEFAPFIIREWDEKGSVIYDLEQYTKALKK